jgi:hypothetical protein
MDSFQLSAQKWIELLINNREGKITYTLLQTSVAKFTLGSFPSIVSNILRRFKHECGKREPIVSLEIGTGDQEGSVQQRLGHAFATMLSQI